MIAVSLYYTTWFLLDDFPQVDCLGALSFHAGKFHAAFSQLPHTRIPCFPETFLAHAMSCPVSGVLVRRVGTAPVKVKSFLLPTQQYLPTIGRPHLINSR